MLPKLTISDLPIVQGEYIEYCDMARFSWFKVGGKAKFLYSPSGLEDMQNFLSALPKDIPFMVIGAGSNMFFRDTGWHGVVARLPFRDIAVNGSEISVGSAVMDAQVSRVALENSIAGLEFLCGIPGSIGGAVAMNAGCYGRETCDVFLRGVFLDNKTGELLFLNKSDMGFSYRTCLGIRGMTLVSATLGGQFDSSQAIKERMDKIKHDRANSHPLGKRTCGSTFRNPLGHKAWQLIQDSGCANLRIGGAYVSEKHSNFITKLYCMNVCIFICRQKCRVVNDVIMTML